MSAKVILFDMDGVIADSWSAFYATWQGFLQDKGFTDLTDEALILALFEGNFFQNLSNALKHHNYQITSHDVQQLNLQLTEAIQHCQPFPGILPWNRRLSAQTQQRLSTLSGHQ